MVFFGSGLFWFIEGIIFFIIILGFKQWTMDKSISMNPLKWILFISWLLFFEFTIGFITTSIGEKETIAALKGGGIFGFLCIMLGIAFFRFILKKPKNSAK